MSNDPKTQADDLLPDHAGLEGCPFCGNHTFPHVEKDSHEFYSYLIHGGCCDASIGCVMRGETPNEVKKMWNTRASSQKDDEIKRLTDGLLRIATTSHVIYDGDKPYVSEHASGYSAGIADGHRLAARWAKEALAKPEGK